MLTLILPEFSVNLRNKPWKNNKPRDFYSDRDERSPRTIIQKKIDKHIGFNDSEAYS